jgi:hypothetical protein
MSELDDRALRDIGIERSRISRRCAAPSIRSSDVSAKVRTGARAFHRTSVPNHQHGAWRMARRAGVGARK